MQPGERDNQLLLFLDRRTKTRAYAFARFPMVRMMRYAPAEPTTPIMAVPTADARSSGVTGTFPGPLTSPPVPLPNRKEGLAMRRTPPSESTPGAAETRQHLGTLRQEHQLSSPVKASTFVYFSFKRMAASTPARKELI